MDGYSRVQTLGKMEENSLGRRWSARDPHHHNWRFGWFLPHRETLTRGIAGKSL
jgi:hypothetical protein